MAFLAGIIDVIGRFAGRVLTTTLGWASSLLFGRVPQSRQIVLALIATDLAVALLERGRPRG